MKANKQVRIRKQGTGSRNGRRVKRSEKNSDASHRRAALKGVPAANTSAESVLRLQQTVGNRAVSHMFPAGEANVYRQTAGNEPMLRFGSRSDAVKMLQHYLVQAGADIAVDGIFGPITHQAVVAFQKENGLAVDGIVGPNTWTILKRGGGTIDADKSGGGAFGQADLFDQATAKLKAIALSLGALSEGPAQGPAEQALSLSEIMSGTFSNEGKTSVVGDGHAFGSDQVRSGQVIMTQPDEKDTASGGAAAQGSNAEMAALLGAAVDVNQAIVGLSTEAAGELGPTVSGLQTVVQQVGVDPANTLNAGTITDLDAFLADIQVVAANTGAGADKNGFTKIDITSDDTYKFKADTIADVGQKLDNHMSTHGEAAHVSNTPSQNLIFDEATKIVQRVELTYSLERILPEWTNADEVGKKCPCWKKEWDRFEEAIKIHEQTHVNIYKKFLAGLHNKCIGKTQKQAEDIINKAEEDVEKLQKAFDDKNDHGQTAPQSTKFNAGISCNGCTK
jgi:peptidoglycan hydrolase-like protein with peptidoglycan-binding domain/predicted secreted Zn-dependent protease